MMTLAKAILSASLATAVGMAQAQVPPELAEKLKAIGLSINPAATSALYAARSLEKEPYQNVQVERDIAYGTNHSDDPTVGDALWGFIRGQS